MIILDGDENGLIHCAGLVANHPNPEHLDEARAIYGNHINIRDLMVDSISGSSLLAYAEKDGAGMVCGVGILGITRFQVWMTTSDGAVDRPMWLWREAMRCIRLFDKFMGKETVYWQDIPANYTRGLNFVRHLGFEEVKRLESITGAELVRVEREVPEWAS